MRLESMELPFEDWDIMVDHHVDRVIFELQLTAQVEKQLREDPRQQVEPVSSHCVRPLRFKGGACPVFI